MKFDVESESAIKKMGSSARKKKFGVRSAYLRAFAMRENAIFGFFTKKKNKGKLLRQVS